MGVLDAELRILDRVYYKGNSQHRSALFWKRATEIRRLARRVQAATFGGLVDGFREAFFADPKNIKRAAWTKVPGLERIRSVQQQLSSISHLLAHGIDRCRAAYGWFVAQLRTTAFFPLAMMLIAIAARLHSVFLSLAEELVKVANAIEALYHRLPVPPNTPRRPLPRLSRALHTLLGTEGLPPAPKDARSVLRAYVNAKEDDLGQSIPRVGVGLPGAASAPAGFPVPVPIGPVEYPLSTPPVLLDDDDALMDVVRDDMVVDALAGDGSVGSLAVELLEPPGQHAAEMPSAPVEVRSTLSTQPRKKKRKPRAGGDEIDAIFGGF